MRLHTAQQATVNTPAAHIMNRVRMTTAMDIIADPLKADGSKNKVIIPTENLQLVILHAIPVWYFIEFILVASMTEFSFGDP